MLAKKHRLNLSQSINQQLFGSDQAQSFQTPHLRFLLREQGQLLLTTTKLAVVIPRKVIMKASQRVNWRRQLYGLSEQLLKPYFHPTSPRHR